jgi:HlyD family secretion protein
VQVKLAVAEPPAFLRQDMTVSVDIEVARHAGALSLTTEAVHDAASPAPWVMVVADGRARRRPVRLGIRGDSRVEVVEGLNEGDLVLPANGVQMAEGARVRASAAASK